jgi:hypothetical protein
MAFLDLELGAPAGLTRNEQRVAPVVPKLGVQERRVVLLARTDPQSSLHRGRISRLSSLLFGIEQPHRLADARLEALRRYAILYRIHGEALPAAETEQARAAGFSDHELGKARSLINATFGARRPRRSTTEILAMVSGAAVAAVAALVGGVQLAAALDSPLIAATLTGVAAVSLAPMAAR